MQPGQMARPTSFDPEALSMIFAAYDAAWSEIAPQLNPDPVAVEAARTALATIVLGLAADTQPTAPNGLTALAVTAFSAKHRIEAECG